MIKTKVVGLKRLQNFVAEKFSFKNFKVPNTHLKIDEHKMARKISQMETCVV